MSFFAFSADELSWIRNELDDASLEIFLQEKWGSQKKNYRELLHTDLKLRGSVVDSSISHTEGIGGYVLTQKTGFQVGIDIEVIDRVRSEIARRVCQEEEEFMRAPSFAALWAAKEAAFKALKGPQQPQTITAIQIGHWQNHNSHYETCRIANLLNFEKSVAKGITLKKKGFVFSFFSVLAE